jgi:hypothetical protein
MPQSVTKYFRRLEVNAGSVSLHGIFRSSTARARVEIFSRQAMVHCLARSVLFLTLPIYGRGDIQTTTQVLSADIASHGKVSLPANVTLRTTSTRFGMLSGSLAVSYWARTSAVGGGSVTVQANSDFLPAGGPSISNVSYTCSGATLGEQCSGNQDLSTSTQASLVILPAGSCTGGGGVCSTQDPNTVLLILSVPSKPSYKTGNYSAQITLTISTV